MSQWIRRTRRIFARRTLSDSQAVDLIKDTFPHFVRKHSLRRFNTTSDKRKGKSVDYFDRADKLFHSELYDDALKCLVVSLASCPENNFLGDIFAKRANVLYALSDNVSAYADCNRALSYEHWSSPQRTEIEELKQIIHDELYALLMHADRDDQALPDPFDETKEIEFSMETFRNEEARWNIRTSTMEYRVNEDITSRPFFQKAGKANTNEMRTLSDLTDKIKIVVDGNRGRCIKALKAIEPGEKLFIDIPYACALAYEFRLSNCSHCLRRTPTLISCPLCTQTLYCGETCLQEAKNSYHEIECQIIILAKKKNKRMRQIRLLALRIFLIATKQSKEGLANLFAHEIYKENVGMQSSVFDETNPLTDYYNVHHLVDHFGEQSRYNRMQDAKRACLLLHYLKHTTYFLNPGPELTELEIFAGTRLLKYLAALRINVFSVIEHLTFDDRTEALCAGTALYPVAHFFNHSCDPNAVVCFDGNRAVAYSLRPLNPGEEICISYDNIIYTEVKSAKRQAHLLDNYFIECNCFACYYNYPVFKRIPSKRSYKKNNPDTGELNRLGYAILNAQGASDYYLRILRRYAALLEENVQRPSLDIIHCEKEIIRVLTLRGGNIYDDSTDVIVNFVPLVGYNKPGEFRP